MKVLKIFYKRLVLCSALLLSSLVFYSCTPNSINGILSREGARFNNDLSQAINTADKITIVEHSFWEDFKGSEVDVRTAPKYTYSSRTLSSSDRAYFAAQVDKLSGAVKKYDHEGCMFAPHYTIMFYKNGEKTSSAEISYRCEDFKWQNGSKHTQSKNLFNSLNLIIKKAGFDPSTNWKKRALDRYEKNQKKKIEKNQVKEKTSITDEIPFGKPVPGKRGFLYNPFTQNQVDVDGIPSGTKIRDPQDPKARVFRVP